MGLFFDSDSFRAAQFVQTTLKIMQRAKTDPVLMGIMERFRRAAVTEADDLVNRRPSDHQAGFQELRTAEVTAEWRDTPACFLLKP